MSESPQWLELRPDHFLSGDPVWTVVRMPDEVTYGHLVPAQPIRDGLIGPPRVTEAEAALLRTAVQEARGCEMDITLAYRIDGNAEPDEQIGPA